MKDWDIVHNWFQPGKTCVVHYHAEGSSRWEERISGRFARMCKRHNDLWYCPLCGAESPEEIAFVALLARAAPGEYINTEKLRVKGIYK